MGGGAWRSVDKGREVGDSKFTSRHSHLEFISPKQFQ